jgi:amidase
MNAESPNTAAAGADAGLDAPLITRDRIVYSFDRDAEPRLEVGAPATVVFETHDARAGRLTRPDQVEETTPDFSERFPKTNPATGPVRVRGAAPGDTIWVEIVAIDLDPAGFVLVKPDMGLVRGLSPKPIAKICPVRDGMVHFGNLAFPVRSMVGVIAVAPAEAPMGTAYVGRHGGNIDCNRAAVGSTIRLPVQVEGALVYLGDVHASMGDGEVSGTGIEIGAGVTARLSLEKGRATRWPWIHEADRIISLAAAPSFEAAAEIAVREMMAELQRLYDIPATEAFMLISAVGDLAVNQSCRSKIDVSVRVEMPRI